CTQPYLMDLVPRTVSVLCDEALIGSLWRSWGAIQMKEGEICPDCFRMVSLPHGVVKDEGTDLTMTHEEILAIYCCGFDLGRDPSTWATSPEGIGCPGADGR